MVWWKPKRTDHQYFANVEQNGDEEHEREKRPASHCHVPRAYGVSPRDIVAIPCLNDRRAVA
jgi:hypothetical protein